MNKIVYIVKTKLHYYPPCISQIRMIHDLGYDIEVLYGTSERSALDLLEKEGIQCTKIGNISDVTPSFFSKLISWFKYRFSLSKKIKTYDSNTIFWFGTAESIIPMIGLLKKNKYVLTLLELLDDNKKKIKLLAPLAKKAQILCVCEETRGYIMKYWWNLPKLPFVFPNKPYNQICDRNHNPSVPETKNIVDHIKNKKVILYQGIIQNSDELCEIAKALDELDNDYLFLLMGIDKYNSVSKLKKIYKNVMFFDYIPAPYHLEITSYAHIGITFYRNDSLNKAFCAPNKIYEYTGFGVPILANDIPGLKNTVGNAKAAECIEITKDNVIKAINNIETNYKQYQNNALNFFESTDNFKTMERLLSELYSKK